METRKTTNGLDRFATRRLFCWTLAFVGVCFQVSGTLRAQVPTAIDLSPTHTPERRHPCPKTGEEIFESWRMSGQSATHNRRTGAFGPQGANGQPPAFEWRCAMPAAVQSSPAVGSKTVYVGCDNGSLYAIHDTPNDLLLNGTIKWSFLIPGILPEFDNNPAVLVGSSRSIVFVGSENGTMYAIEDRPTATAGVPLWEKSDVDPILSSPSLKGRNVYYCNNAGKVLVRSVATGALFAQFAMGAAPGSRNSCSPSVVTTYNGYFDIPQQFRTPDCTNWVYVGDTLGTVYALKEGPGTLTPVWTFTFPTGVAAFPITVDTQKDVVYAISSSGYLYAFNRFNGVPIWTVPAPIGNTNGIGNETSPSVALGWNGVLYVGNNEREVVAVNSVTGAINWKLATANTYIHSHPAVGRGDSTKATIFVGSDDRKLRAIRDLGNFPNVPVIQWQITGPGVHSSAAISPEGALYVGSYDAPRYLYKYK